MAEEVKVIVSQETRGTALKDALADKEKLKNDATTSDATPAAGPRGGKVDYAALQRQRDQAAAVMAGQSSQPEALSASQAAAAKRDEAAMVRKAALAKELKALQANAAGDTTTAGQLEREAEIMRRSLAIQRSTNLPAANATEIAKRQVDVEAKITEQKLAQAQAVKAAKAAAEEAAAAERAAARELVINKKAAASEEKAAQAAAKVKPAEAAPAEAASQVGGFAIGGLIAGVVAGAAQLALKAVKAIPEYLFTQRAADESGQNRLASERAAGQRRIGLAGGFRGSAGQSLASMDSGKEELAQARDRRIELERAAKDDWHALNPLRWSNALLGTEFKSRAGKRAISENEQHIGTLASEVRGDQKNRDAQFAKDGLLQLQFGEKLAQNDRGGARAIEDKLTWLNEYKRVLHEVGEENEWQAQQSAGQKVFEDQKARAGNFAHLVNSHTGSAGTAQLATMADMQMRGDPRLLGTLTGLRTDVAKANKEAADLAWRTKFSRK